MFYSKIDKNRALSLVEVIIFMLIVSSMIAALMSMVNFFTITSGTKMTKLRMEAVRSALKFYVDVHSKLPCPASFSNDSSNANYGKSSDCSSLSSLVTSDSNGESVVHGVVPFKTLGLPESYAYDIWGGKILYVVPQYLTLTKSINEFYSYKPKDSNGAIKIKNINGNSVIDVSKNVLSYLLLSHGRKMIGAYKANKVQIACSYSTGINGIDIENCNADSNFKHANLNYSDSAYFDDLMLWSTTQELSPAVAASVNKPSVASAFDIGGRLFYVHGITNGSSAGLIDGMRYLYVGVFGNDNFIVKKESKGLVNIEQCFSGDRIITNNGEFFIIYDNTIFYDVGDMSNVAVINGDIKSDTSGAADISLSPGFYLLSQDSLKFTNSKSGISSISFPAILFISNNSFIGTSGNFDDFAFNAMHGKIVLYSGANAKFIKITH